MCVCLFVYFYHFLFVPIILMTCLIIFIIKIYYLILFFMSWLRFLEQGTQQGFKQVYLSEYLLADLSYHFYRAAYGAGANLKISVEEIPDDLNVDEDEENVSNHASVIFRENNQNIRWWFRHTLMLPESWDLEHPLDHIGTSNNFVDYVSTFPQQYKIWDIQNRQDATLRVTLYNRQRRSVTLAGRADYLITRRFSDNGVRTTKSDFLEGALCIIEVQSSPDIVQCQHQMLAYLYIHMNVKGHRHLIGFLVLLDGRVQAYKASRQGSTGGVVYEENDYFHVSHIANMFVTILNQLENAAPGVIGADNRLAAANDTAADTKTDSDEFMDP